MSPWGPPYWSMASISHSRSSWAWRRRVTTTRRRSSVTASSVGWSMPSKTRSSDAQPSARASRAARPSGPGSSSRSSQRSSPWDVAHSGLSSRNCSQARSAKACTRLMATGATDTTEPPLRRWWECARLPEHGHLVVAPLDLGVDTQQRTERRQARPLARRADGGHCSNGGYASCPPRAVPAGGASEPVAGAGGARARRRPPGSARGRPSSRCGGHAGGPRRRGRPSTPRRRGRRRGPARTRCSRSPRAPPADPAPRGAGRRAARGRSGGRASVPPWYMRRCSRLVTQARMPSRCANSVSRPTISPCSA